MIPLVLLTGFLGSGKTRFLTELIPRLTAHGVRVRVLLNDFENASIDAARLGDLDALVTPLDGACVCCTSLNDLMDALAAVPADPGSVLLIEANGATDAAELLGYLSTGARLAHFTPPLQLTVLDAARWQKRWWHNRLEAAQARTATQLFLNRTERLAPARVRAVEESVRAIAPRAAMVSNASFAETLAALAAEMRDIESRPEIAAGAAQRQRAGEAGQRSGAHVHAEHAMHHEHAAPHEHPFASAAIGLPHTVRREAFLAFVRALPPGVVRAKGLVRFGDEPGVMYVWNHVQGRRGVQFDASSAHTEAEPVALLIGVGMPVAELSARIAVLGPESSV